MKTSEKKESGGIRRAEGNREFLVREKYVVLLNFVRTVGTFCKYNVISIVTKCLVM